MHRWKWLALVVGIVVLAACEFTAPSGQTTVKEDDFNGQTGCSTLTSCWQPNWHGGSDTAITGSFGNQTCADPSQINENQSGSGQVTLNLANTSCSTFAWDGSVMSTFGKSCFGFKNVTTNSACTLSTSAIHVEFKNQWPNFAGNYINWPAVWVDTTGNFGTCQGWPYGGEWDVAEVLGTNSNAAHIHRSGTLRASGCTTSTANSDDSAVNVGTMSSTADSNFHVSSVDLTLGSNCSTSPYVNVTATFHFDSTNSSSNTVCVNPQAGWNLVEQNICGSNTTGVPCGGGSGGAFVGEYAAWSGN